MRIFISYSRVDKATAKIIVELLERVYGRGDVWYDDNLTGGVNWWDEILQQINACAVFIYLLSNESVTSPYCQAEFAEARRLQKRIVTVQVRDRTNMPPDLSDIQYVDLSKGVDDAENLAQMYAAVHHQLEHARRRRPLSRTPTPRPDVPTQEEEAQRETPQQTPILSLPSAPSSHLPVQSGESPPEKTPTTSSKRGQRLLEAATPKETKIGKPTELRVKISLPNSEGLRGELPDYTKTGELLEKIDVRSSSFPMSFPLDHKTGTLLPAPVCIEIESADFIATTTAPASMLCAENQVELDVPQDIDSRTLVFKLTPHVENQAIGFSTITINIYQNNKLIAQNSVSTEIVEETVGIPDPPAWNLVVLPLMMASDTFLIRSLKFLRHILSDQMWQGVGVIVAIMLFLVPIGYSALNDDEPTVTPIPSLVSATYTLTNTDTPTEPSDVRTLNARRTEFAATHTALISPSPTITNTRTPTLTPSHTPTLTDIPSPTSTDTPTDESAPLDLSSYRQTVTQSARDTQLAERRHAAMTETATANQTATAPSSP